MIEASELCIAEALAYAKASGHAFPIDIRCTLTMRSEGSRAVVDMTDASEVGLRRAGLLRESASSASTLGRVDLFVGGVCVHPLALRGVRPVICHQSNIGRWSGCKTVNNQ